MFCTILSIGGLNLLSGLTVILLFFLGLFKLKSLGKDYVLLFVFVTISAAVEIASALLSMKGINNLWMGNIFFLVECFFLGIIIWQWLESKKLRIFIFVFLVTFLPVWVFTTFFVLDFYKFNNYARAIESIVFVFLACFLLIAVSTDASQAIYKNPKFWFGSGLLIYFSVNLVVFGTVNYILLNREHLMDNTWVIHSVTNIFANLLFATGFLCIKRKAT